MLELKASEYPIKSVTVFRKSSKAEVVRTFDIDLQIGQNQILIKDLPSTIDTDSVRISGLGSVRLADVVCTNQPTTPPQFPTKQSNVVAELVLKKAALLNQKEIHQYEAHLLTSYGKSITGEHVAPKDFESFLKSFVENGKRSIEASHALSAKIVEIEKQIEDQIRNENQDTKQGSQNGRVSLTLSADVDVKDINIKMTYMVSKASWEPTYELHASTDSTGKASSSLALYYRARINQSTGEDWTDTQITLSTVSVDSLFKSIPNLTPMKIRPSAIRGGFAAFANKSLPDEDRDRPSFQKPTGFASIFGQTNTVSPFGQPAGGFGPSSNSGTVFGGSGFNPSSNSFAQSNPIPFAQTQTLDSFGSNNPTSNAFGGFGSNSSQPPPPFPQRLFQQQAVSGPFSQQQQQPSIFDSVPPAHPQEAATSNTDDGFEEIALPTNDALSTLVSETPLAVSFLVQGQSTIPSDGLPHQAEIAKLDFEGKIEYVVVPRADATVYVQCQVKNISEYRLLPGPVTVLLDDSYVSRTTINDINTNDTFTCTLGADASAKVTYTRKAKTVKSSGGAFTEEQKTTTFTVHITIQNKHQFTLNNLIVRDLIPTSVDERVKVILRKPEGLATLRNGDELAIASITPGLKVRWCRHRNGSGGEKEGTFEWFWAVAAGSSISLESEWDVKFPADLNLHEGPAVNVNNNKV